MLNLIKYEIDRRRKAILTFLAIVIVVQSLIIFGFYRGGGWIALSVFSIVLITISVYLFMIFDGIRTYYSDLNRSEGYMLFLTPNSGYKIIASKLVVNFFELVLFVFAAVVMLLLDYFIIKNLFIDSGSVELKQFFYALAEANKDVIPSIGHIFLYFFTTAIQWFNIIVMAILAITLTKTILSNTRYSWLISIGLYIAISIGIQFLSMGVTAAFGIYSDIKTLINFVVRVGPEQQFSIEPMPTIGDVVYKYTAVMTALYIIYISVFYYLSGWLLDKRIDL
jgi:hypothetical protein